MTSQGEPSLKRLLGWLIAGTKGGPTRAEIICGVKETPQNANQLASRLDKDYRTIRHHLEILSKNGIITSGGDRYGTTYFLPLEWSKTMSIFEEIVGKLWERPKGNNGKGSVHEQESEVFDDICHADIGGIGRVVSGNHLSGAATV